MKQLLFFALPIMITNFVNALSGLTSMYLLARFDANLLASGAIISSTLGFVMMMILSILYAISIKIGQSLGESKPSAVGSIVFSGLCFAVIIGAPLTLLMQHMTLFFELLGQTKEISIASAEYFKGFSFGVLPSLMFAVYCQFLYGVGKSQVVLYVTLISVLINSILSYVFIFGIFFLTSFGTFGAGIAAAITSWLMFFIMSAYIFKQSSFRPYHLFKKTSVNYEYLSSIFKLGVPISIQYSFELLAFSTLTYLMGMVSKEALNAQQILMQTSIIPIMIIMSVGQSISILVGKAMGQNDLNQVNTIAKQGFVFMMAVMIIFSGIYLLFPLQIINIYLNVHDPKLIQTIALSKLLLMLSACSQFFDAGRNITASVLRGLGDTQSSMWTGIVSCWVIGMPLSITLGFGLHWGALGLRLGLMIGIMAGCLLILYQFYSTRLKMTPLVLHKA